MNGLWISPVKFISVLLAATLTAQATPSDPGKAAIDFLEKVRRRELNLEPGGDTALSAQTADDKKHQIARRLERMAHDLGSDPLEVGEVKTDENFAAVLVRKIGGFDTSSLQVFPIALVKRGAEWTAAPVPASFENAGTGYASALRKRVEALETWMLREQVLDLELLREQSATRMRQKIEVNLPVKDLRNCTAQQAGERFITACIQRDLPSMLGYLGGLAKQLPEDWPARLKAADHAVSAGAEVARPWRLLLAPEVIRISIRHEAEDDRGEVTIACLDPAGNGRESGTPVISTVNLGLTKTADNLWQITPPDEFLQDATPSAEDADENSDPDLLDDFPVKWSAAHPPAHQPTAELVYQSLTKALHDSDLPTVLTLLDLSNPPSLARASCIEAARIWWTIHAPASVRHTMPLAFKEDGAAAVGLFQFFSAKDPNFYEPQAFYFEKSATGWCWNPTPTDKVKAPLQAWVDAETKHWSERWQSALMANCLTLEKIDGLPVPTEDAARGVVLAWLDATHRGDVPATLSITTRLNTPESATTTLQNLGYEILGARHHKQAPLITGIYQGKCSTAVGVRIDHDGKFNYPLYPVIQTAQGPRILVEIDLIAAGNRGRDFLNRTALARLWKADPAAADDFKKLYSQHQAKTDGTAPASPP